MVKEIIIWQQSVCVFSIESNRFLSYVVFHFHFSVFSFIMSIFLVLMPYKQWFGHLATIWYGSPPHGNTYLWGESGKKRSTMTNANRDILSYS